MASGSPWFEFERFLDFGTEGTVTYAGRASYVPEETPSTAAAIREDGLRAVATIQSSQRRAARNFALALAASLGDGTTRKAALDALPQLAESSMDLFAFCEGCRGLRGWGRGLRNAVARWYLSRSLPLLAQELVNCPEGLGWSHRDLLRLCHPVADSPERDALFHWAVTGEGSLPAQVTGPCPVPTLMPLPLSRRVALCIDGSVAMASSRVPGSLELTTWQAAREIVRALPGAEIFGYSDHVFAWPGFDSEPTATGAFADPGVLSTVEAEGIVILTHASMWAARRSPSEVADGRKLVVVGLGSDRALFGEQPTPDVLHIVGYSPDVAGLIAAFFG